MDDGSAPRRIEIELTEDTRRRSRRTRTRATATAIPTDTGVEPTPVIDSGAPVVEGVPVGPDRERKRLLVAALAVAAVSLFLGWVLGRAGDGDGEVAQTVDATATTLDEPADVTTAANGDTLPAAELPTTTRPRRTTTTTLPPDWQTSTVEIDPRLAGQTDRIVAIDDSSGLAEVDLATGALRTLRPARGFPPQPLPPIAGDDWVMLPTGSGGGDLLYRGDATVPEVFSLSDTRTQLLWAYDTDLFWVTEFDPTQGGVTGASEWDIEGQPTGRTIDTRGLWPGGADPAGGVLVGGGSLGVFAASPEGSVRLPDGQLLAVSARHVVVYACAENLDSCGVSVVDRETGEARSVPFDFDLGNLLNRFGGFAPPRPPINGDGSAALITTFGDDGAHSIGALDLVTGEYTPFDEPSLSESLSSAVWSADGRFAYAAIDGVIRAYDRTTGELFDVVAAGALDPIRSLTVRPPTA